MSASKSEVRKQTPAKASSGKKKSAVIDVNAEVNAEAVKRDREHKIRKFAESPIEVARAAIESYANRDVMHRMAETGCFCAITEAEIEKFLECRNRSDNLAHAVIMAANLGSGHDYASMYGLPGFNENSDLETNEIVMEIAGIYKRRMAAIQQELPYDDFPGLRDFEHDMRFEAGICERYCIACLEYYDARITWNKSKLDFAEPAATVVRAQFSTDGLDRHHVMTAYGHLVSGEPDDAVCRMVVKSHEMIGNDRISMRAVLDMIRDRRIVKIIGMNQAMAEAFAELNQRILQDEARKASNVEQAIDLAGIVGDAGSLRNVK